MADARDAGDGSESVDSDETDATVDERDLPRPDGDKDAEETEAAEEDESESGEGATNGDGGGGGPSFRVREAECGESVLVIVDISLPPVNRPGAKSRMQSYLFLRQCEELLYGSTAGSYTGALHMAVKVCVLARGDKGSRLN